MGEEVRDGNAIVSNEDLLLVKREPGVTRLPQRLPVGDLRRRKTVKIVHTFPTGFLTRPYADEHVRLRANGRPHRPEDQARERSITTYLHSCARLAVLYPDLVIPCALAETIQAGQNALPLLQFLSKDDSPTANFHQIFEIVGRSQFKRKFNRNVRPCRLAVNDKEVVIVVRTLYCSRARIAQRMLQQQSRPVSIKSNGLPVHIGIARLMQRFMGKFDTVALLKNSPLTGIYDLVRSEFPVLRLVRLAYNPHADSEKCPSARGFRIPQTAILMLKFFCRTDNAVVFQRVVTFKPLAEILVSFVLQAGNNT